MVATLLGEPFRLRLEEIAGLTDRQIYDLYCHPRDKEGRIDTASGRFGGAGEMTADQEDQAMRQLASALHMTEKQVRELQERAHAKRSGPVPGRVAES